MLFPTGRSLSLSCVFYGEHAATIQVSDDENLWHGRIDSDGLVYVVAPTLQRFSGPHPLSALVAARHDRTVGAQVLSTFLDDCSREHALPPYHLDGTPAICLIAGKFEASIHEAGGEKVLGIFASEEEAASAIDAAQAEYRSHDTRP